MVFYRKSSFYVVLFYIFLLTNLILKYLNYVSIARDLGIYFYISLIIFLFASIGILAYFLLRVKSLSIYKRYIKNLDKTNYINFLLNPNFPNNDELGNLGSYINKLISTMREFDDLKKNKLMLKNKLNNSLVNKINKPMMILDDEFEIEIINDSFLKEFKELKERKLLNIKSSSIFNSQSYIDFLTNISSNKDDKIKNEIECNVVENSYILNIQSERIKYLDLILYCVIIEKKHKNIFSK